MRGPGRAAGILSYFTRHGTAANLVLVLMIAAGLASLPRMRSQYFPDVVVEEITVSIEWEGAGAEDVDAAIVQLLEPALIAVEGVDATSSQAREGRATMTLEFEPGWDMAQALSDVDAAVAAAGTLPEGAEEPEIRRANWRDRVTDVVITGPVSVAQLARFADELVGRLFAEGVTRTTIQGLAAPETVVEVSSASLIRHDVTMAEIASAIAAEAAGDPAGDVGGAARVRTGTEKRALPDIGAIVLRTNPDGSSLSIGDVATLRVEGEDRARAYYVGGNPAMTVRVDRSDRGDAIGIQTTVEQVAEEMMRTLPQGVSLDLIRTRSESIKARLAILIENGAMGLALVLGLLFLFLNARTAFWVAAGIPVAMLAAIAAMYLAGLTINMMSLFALIITLGIVVDDAIVVGEHADFRARKLREGAVVASENAARRMAAPVFSSTMTTVIAFFGLMAVGGRFGELIADIPFTVIAVLMASLLECFLILPNHMSHALAHVGEGRWYDAPSRVVNRGFGWLRDRFFRPFIALVIRLRYPVLAAAALVLASQVAMLIDGRVQWRFFNAPEQGSISGNFAMLPGASRVDTVEMMRLVQEATEALGRKYEGEYGRNPVTYAIAEIGGNSGRALASADTKEADLLGAISIELIDPDLRPYSSFQFVGELQDAVPRHPMLEELSFRGWRQGPGGDALDIEFFGADAAVLKEAAETLKTALARFPEVSAVEDTLAYDKEELILDLTPQGQALGFTIDGLGQVLRNRLNGIEAATFPDGPRSATVRVELPQGELQADFLERMMLRSAAGQYVPLGDIVSVQSRSGFTAIRRENGLRTVSVTGDVDETDPVRAAEITAALQDEILPEIEARYGVAWDMAGLSEQEDEFLGDAMTGLWLSLLGIYLTLAWIFASWTRPAAVMAIIPFGLVGAIWGHYLWDLPMSMFSIVGLIGMVGIIINDSIVLVSTVDEYAENRALGPAIIDAVADRLRPVLLTTLTTVLGLAPLLYESSSQALFLKPTVVTLCYGLGFGLVLVLTVVPALLAVQQDVARHVAGFRRAARPRTGRARPLMPLLVATGMAMAVIFVAVFAALLTGALADLLPAALASHPVRMAVAVFGAGAALVAFVAWMIGAATIARRRRVQG